MKSSRKHNLDYQSLVPKMDTEMSSEIQIRSNVTTAILDLMYFSDLHNFSGKRCSALQLMRWTHTRGRYR